MAKNLNIKDRNIRIQIWDTAGQEAFRSITRSYYKNSTCAFIVYDITSKKTFDNVEIWLKECSVCRLLGSRLSVMQTRLYTKTSLPLRPTLKLATRYLL